MSPPKQIGRYRIERRLGTGAFGVVWLAHDDRLQALVAIKVMAENWAYRMDIRERFLSEARLLRRSSATGLVQVFDIGELPDDRPYFVMEYADGGTLEDRLSAGPLPVAEALDLTAQAARGVAALHDAGVVHRDIKPSNVLLARAADGRERVLVADLGLAKSLAQASGLTLTAGSAGYMAPEQADPGATIDARADVYGLGALLYHLITGTVPGPPGKVVRPDRLLPGVPAGVQRAVLRALEVDRHRRWPTASVFADELERLSGQRTGRASRRSRSRRPVAIGGIAVVVALAAGLAATVQQHREHVSVERVKDATGQVSVEVPSSWAAQLLDAGWTPKALGLPDAHAPALTVAQDVRHWTDLDKADSGVFVGLEQNGDLTDRVDAISHRNCVYQGGRGFSDGDWHGRIRTWTSCGTNGHSLEEIGLVPVRPGLPQAYLQIRQGSGADRTGSILRSLRVTG